MFDFFYGNEPKQFAFYSIPQLLFTDEKFKSMSCEAKVLYGLLLDKAGLSSKNGWTDKDGKVFVYFKREDICTMLCCKKDKASKILAELDDEKGIGLIKRVSQGQGKPAKIYVRHFLRVIDDEVAGNPANDILTAKQPNNSESDYEIKTDVKRAEKPLSRERKNRRLEDGKTDVLSNEPNQENHTELSSLSIIQDNNRQKPTSNSARNMEDRIDKIGYLNKLEDVRQRVNADYLLEIINTKTGLNFYSPDEIDELVELIAWAELTTQPAIKINGEYIDSELVRLRFAKLDEGHIQYVLDCVNNNTVKISQRRNYLLTCLYNAPSTISGYYSNDVRSTVSL